MASLKLVLTLFLLSFGIVASSIADAAPSRQEPTVSTAQPDDASPFAQQRKLLQLGKSAEAIAQLEAMQNQTPPPKGLAHELGVAYYKKRDYLNAVVNLQKALNEDPEDKEAIQHRTVWW